MERNFITQTDIALKAGVSRSTVNRLFNPKPTHRVTQTTAMKVLRAAKELGYDPKKAQMKTERRAAERKRVDLDVDVDIVLKSGKPYDTGTATIENLSILGALLTNIKTSREHLPMEPFYVRLTFKGGDEDGVSFRAEFMRMHGAGRVELAIRFERLLKKTQAALKKMLES